MAVLLPVALLAAALLWWAIERSRRTRHAVPAGLQKDVLLPHREEFELYHNALSLCSMKSRVCLAELGIPYASHPVDLIETGSYENIRPEFLRVNPGGTVPVLVHQDEVSVGEDGRYGDGAGVVDDQELLLQSGGQTHPFGEDVEDTSGEELLRRQPLHTGVAIQDSTD